MTRVAVAVLGVAALAVAAAAGTEATIEPPVDPVAQPVAQDAAPAGAWYCAATGGGEDAARLSVAAVGTQPSTVAVVSYARGSPTAADPFEVAPGDQRDVDVDPRHPVAVRWQGGPAVVSWQVRSGGEAAGAPCAASPSPTWHLPGFDTALGARSTLHLFNPFTVDAVARVTFATQDGPMSLQRTDSVVVGAGRAARLDLNELQPEQSELGTTVTVLSGRLVAAGEIRFDPPPRPDGGEGQGPRGRVLLAAAPDVALDWGFALARSDDNADSWLVLANPGDRDAAVELRASEPIADSALLGEVLVPAGATVRVWPKRRPRSRPASRPRA